MAARSKQRMYDIQRSCDDGFGSSASSLSASSPNRRSRPSVRQRLKQQQGGVKEQENTQHINLMSDDGEDDSSSSDSSFDFGQKWHLKPTATMSHAFLRNHPLDESLSSSSSGSFHYSSAEFPRPDLRPTLQDQLSGDRWSRRPPRAAEKPAASLQTNEHAVLRHSDGGAASLKALRPPLHTSAPPRHQRATTMENTINTTGKGTWDAMQKALKAAGAAASKQEQLQGSSRSLQPDALEGSNARLGGDENEVEDSKECPTTPKSSKPVLRGRFSNLIGASGEAPTESSAEAGRSNRGTFSPSRLLRTKLRHLLNLSDISNMVGDSDEMTAPSRRGRGNERTGLFGQPSKSSDHTAASKHLGDSTSTNMSTPKIKDSALRRISFEASGFIDDGSVEPNELDRSNSSHAGAALPRRPSSEDEDSPRKLIRRETRTLRALRLVVVLTLIALTAITVALVYRNTRMYDYEAFLASFDDTAALLIESFLRDVRIKLSLASTVSAVLLHHVQAAEGDYAHLNLDTEAFRDITKSQMDVSGAVRVEWSPLLRTKLQRDEFLRIVKESNRTERTGLFRIDTNSTPVDQDSDPPYYPVWLQSGGTHPGNDRILSDQYSDSVTRDCLNHMTLTQAAASQQFAAQAASDEVLGSSNRFLICQPVVSDGELIGALTSEFLLNSLLATLPARGYQVDILIQNSCSQTSALRFDETGVLRSHPGNVTSTPYRDMAVSSSYDDFDALLQEFSTQLATNSSAAGIEMQGCSYRISVQPTTDLESMFDSGHPFIFAISFCGLLLASCLLFFAYDCIISTRQMKILEAAIRSNAIVSSLFPKSFRTRLLTSSGGGGSSIGRGVGGSVKGTSARTQPSTLPSTRSANTGPPSIASQRTLLPASPRRRLRQFLDVPSHEMQDIEPIAESFEAASVMFLDIVGFTAWSSQREPAQVFTLLETVYQAFDAIAIRLGVFKIETIGDSYVAVSGVPEARDDHAVAGVRFAMECVKKFGKLAKQLEVQLGPSTGELQVRVGLHSGPVTGGVLRGDKARFQLFGDTMNTASRMESNGSPGLIQVSETTAALLITAGKEHWLRPRADLVSVKGKGKLKTYWIEPHHKSLLSSVEMSSLDLSDDQIAMQTEICKSMRLIEWGLDVLLELLQKIVASRDTGRPRLARGNSVAALLSEDESRIMGSRGTAIKELVAEPIEMPRFDPRAAKRISESDSVALNDAVKSQLREFLIRISSMYREIPFHNYERACHSAMSCNTLLRRILGRDHQFPHEMARERHQSTFGIISDPLMQFAAVLSALIGNVDHAGMSNSQQVNNRTPSAIMYKNRSVSQQNAIDVTWTVLMDEDFDQLRSCIYSSKNELRRFRQMIVTGVLAMDAEDESLRKARDERWDTAFSEDGTAVLRGRKDIRDDRKASCVYELILAASGMTHTMQHWQTFSSWNEKEFEEAFVSYLAGHESEDPVLNWYEQELKFLSEVAIPTAERLHKSGLFGSSSSSDEFSSRAEENRREWELQGEVLLEKMHAICRARHAKKLH